MGRILRKPERIMQIGNYFSGKYDNFKLDRGWYNSKYYGELWVSPGGRANLDRPGGNFAGIFDFRSEVP